MALDFTQTELTLAEIYTFTLNNGTIFRATSHNEDITYNSLLYQAIPMKRSPVRYHTDLQVDKLSITLGLVGIQIGTFNLSIPTVVRRGFIQNAHVTIKIIDYVALDDEQNVFEGWITGDIAYDSGSITVEVGSILDKLQEKFPKIVYTELCNHQLYSTYCGLTKADYKESSTVDASSTAGRIYSSIFAFSNHSEGYWEKGELQITESGSENESISRTIKDHQDGYVDLVLPFDVTPTLGDAFDAWPGCDKTGTTCVTRFSNYENFLGFEYIPKPETLTL